MCKSGVWILFAGLTICIRPIAAAVSVSLASTTTRIRYLVAIDDENISFDHYFATYPTAANLPGEPRFVALPNTPLVNGIAGAIANQNPNLANPFRSDRSPSIVPNILAPWLCEMDSKWAEDALSCCDFVGFSTGR